MKSFVLSTLLLVFSASQLFGQSSDLSPRLQEVLTQAAEDGQFAGGVAGMLIGEEETVVAAGYRDGADKKPFEVLTLNRTASIVKSMTAIAALQLYEQGKLDLDEPIATHLPKYPRQYAEQITTRHLLQHSSGIGAYQSRKEMKSQVEYTTLAGAAAVFQYRPLLAEPGKVENYTTYGYVVLGMVIEAVSGLSYEEYMQKHVWTAAGMEHTGVEHYGQDYENKSGLFIRKKNGKILAVENNNLSNRAPGGGVHSTASDLLKFGKAVLENRLVKPSTLELMITAPGIAYEGNPYGMGFFLYGENPNLGTIYGHTGSQTGCSSVLFIFPEQDAVLIMMTNTSGSGPGAFTFAVQKMFPLLKAAAGNKD